MVIEGMKIHFSDIIMYVEGISGIKILGVSSAIVWLIMNGYEVKGE
jgi:hypothetical protein